MLPACVYGYRFGLENRNGARMLSGIAKKTEKHCAHTDNTQAVCFQFFRLPLTTCESHFNFPDWLNTQSPKSLPRESKQAISEAASMSLDTSFFSALPIISATVNPFRFLWFWTDFTPVNACQCLKHYATRFRFANFKSVWQYEEGIKGGIFLCQFLCRVILCWKSNIDFLL